MKHVLAGRKNSVNDYIVEGNAYVILQQYKQTQQDRRKDVKQTN